MRLGLAFLWLVLAFSACSTDADPIVKVQLRLSLPENNFGSVPFSTTTLRLGELTYELARTSSGTITAYRNLQLLDSVGIRAELLFALGSGADRQVFTTAMNVISNSNAVKVLMELEANDDLEVASQELEVFFSVGGDAFEDGWRYTAECTIELDDNDELQAIRVRFLKEDEEVEDAN